MIYEEDIEDLSEDDKYVHILFKYDCHPRTLAGMGRHGRKKCFTLKNSSKYINYENAIIYKKQNNFKEVIFKYSGMIFDDVLDKFSNNWYATSNVKKITGEENIPKVK